MITEARENSCTCGARARHPIMTVRYCQSFQLMLSYVYTLWAWGPTNFIPCVHANDDVKMLLDQS